MNLIEKLKDRLGDFWWYSIMLFLALRLADFFNVFVGLWLVPTYVKPEELGAVLPLTNFAALLGVPISVIVTTFSRQVTIFAAQGEYGKIKAMMRDVFLYAGVFSTLMILLANFLIPAVFERLRIDRGALGFVIIASTMVTTIAPIYPTALQALKKFNSLSLINALSAPIRLIVMLVAMPFRPLTGYFVGQASSPLFQIFASLFSLRREFGDNIKAEPYWTPDLKRTLFKYMMLILTFQLPGVVGGFISTLIIRQRLPDIDSAAYYFISRFAEVATFLGVTMSAILFPLVVESNEKGDNSQKLLWHSMLGSIGFGVLLTLAFFLTGKFIFSFLPNGNLYVSYIPHLAWLTMIYAAGAAYTCFTSFKVAQSNFSFFTYHIPLCLIECGILICFTGITFFTGTLPDSIIFRIQTLNPCSLNFILTIMSLFTIVRFIGVGIQLLLRHEKINPKF